MRPGIFTGVRAKQPGRRLRVTHFALPVAAFVLATGSQGQEITGDAAKPDLPTIVITATRTKTPVARVPSAVEMLDGNDLLQHRQARTLPEALRDLPGIMVQKTGHGQGSPYIRGFTGFRTLLLIDGIRLNNSTFRDGPNQYWNTVDPLSVARLEIIKSPGSVLYGSDAVGGTVHAISSPVAGHAGQNSRIHYRHGSAERADQVRLESSFHDRRGSGMRGGVTLKNYGSLVGGSEVGTQPKTGYDEADGDVRVDWHPGGRVQLTMAHQRVHQADAWRTHSTLFGTNWAGLDNGSDRQRSLDQDRALTYVQANMPGLGGGNHHLRVSASVQAQDEEQLRVRNDGRRNESGVDVTTTGLWFQLESELAGHLLVYGVDWYSDQADSFRRDFNAAGVLTSTQAPGPIADGARYDLAGAFLQDQWRILPEVELIVGVRYTTARAQAGNVVNPADDGTWELDQSWSDLVSSARLSWQPSGRDDLVVFAGVSQAFRAPNLSDLTRFDFARSNEVEVPTNGLAPERFTALEAGMRWQVSRWSGQAAVYFTGIENLIVRQPTGELIDGAFVVTRRNSSQGYIRGAELSVRYALTQQWALQGGWGWLEGEADAYPDNGDTPVTEPMDRLMPAAANVALRYTHATGGWLEMALRHAAKQDRLSSRDAGDTQRIPPGGTPSFTVLAVRAGFNLSQRLHLSAAVENLANVDYRVHGSGVNEAGRNLVISLDWRR